MIGRFFETPITRTTDLWDEKFYFHLGTNSLFHEASLAVTIGINLGVHLVHQARLAIGVMGGMLVVGTVGTGGVVHAAVVVGTVGAVGALASKSAGLAGKGISSLLATSDAASGLLELVHGHGGEGRGGVVLGFVVVNLVDLLGVVDDVGLDGLLVNDWLDSLVDVYEGMLVLW